jgi:hypothetical protein
MAQKWNLQDIKPVAPRKSRREAPDVVQQRHVKEVDREEAPEVASIALKNGNKQKRRSGTAIPALRPLTDASTALKTQR